jgi:hypothetical protein
LFARLIDSDSSLYLIPAKFALGENREIALGGGGYNVKIHQTQQTKQNKTPLLGRRR